MSSDNSYMFDLFAGCGGLSTGLERHGFKPILVSELNRDALDSYLANRDFSVGGKPFSDWNQLHFQDVYDLTDSKMKELKKIFRKVDPDLSFRKGGSDIDLICGGPPCQGYSGIGHRRSYSVDKKDIPSNQLYEKMAEVIEFYRPKIFLFENVRGLLSSKWSPDGSKGDIWRDVKSRYADISGYKTKWSLVRAKDYGVPQNRPRVLLVGIRDDIIKASSSLTAERNDEDAVTCGFLPKPTGKAPHPEELLSDLIDPETELSLLSNSFPADFSTRHYKSAPLTNIQRKLRTRPDGTIMRKGSSLKEQEYSRHKQAIVHKFEYMLKNQGAIPAHMKTKKFAQRPIPATWGEKGPSITATSLPDDYVHFCQPRILTVREWARLQLFPDWYEFKGKRTTGGIRRAGNPRAGVFDREVPKYTQIGNAVPVGLADKVGEHFRKILTEASC